MPRLERLLRRATVFLNVSGGKDRAAAAARALDVIRSVAPEARVYMLYAHTPLALPENLEYVESLARWLGVELLVARPREGLEALARRGWPWPWRRWCMYRWKLEPMHEITRRYPAPRLHVIGVRAGESRRRLSIFGGYTPREPWFYCLKWRRYCAWYWAPIVSWSEGEVWEYIRRRGIPVNPLWRRGRHSSHDCVVCLPYAELAEYLWLKAAYPGLWRRLYETYRRMNENRRRGPKILAWGYTDLDLVNRIATLEEFMRPARRKCESCLVLSG